MLGDTYEYLMRKFAQDSGRSKGQFYTPGEVSRVMARVIGLDKATSSSMTVYDIITLKLIQINMLEMACY
ncbi:N-6 DNA methylase [Enterococcus innesii]|uniref:N-6 DNA methylase n=1 Tax=Enterococcus innesii TaxID=2839759 RepID=UPI003B599116